jgi:hypothetical protein
MRRRLSPALVCGVLALLCGMLDAAHGATGTFEDVAARASAVTDLSMLVPPFVDDCSQRRREPDRGRCLGVRTFLRRDLPVRSFLMNRAGSEALGISEYDAAIRGFRLAVSGCLVCGQPVAVGAERRFVTLKAPVKGAKTLRSGTELGRTNVTFPNPTEAERWAKSVRPKLRAEYVFQPADDTWTAGTSRGLAFKPLAFRVYDACTGTVVFSQPPSREPGPKDEGCTAEPVAAAADKPSPADPAAHEPLDPGAINTAVSAVRAEFDGCTNQYPTPGTATLVFVVASTGMPQSVAVEGGAAGTALGQCLIDAGTKVRFPQFQGASQRFKYPLSLQK